MRSIEALIMTNKEKKSLAKNLYIKGNLSQTAIAEKVGCSRSSVSEWIKKGKWDELKESQTLTRGQLLQDAYKQLKAINNEIEQNHKGIPTKHLSDAKGVIRKEIEVFSENALYQYVGVFDEMTDWLEKNHPKELLKMTELINDFIEEIAKKIGL